MIIIEIKDFNDHKISDLSGNDKWKTLNEHIIKMDNYSLINMVKSCNRNAPTKHTFKIDDPKNFRKISVNKNAKYVKNDIPENIKIIKELFQKLTKKNEHIILNELENINANIFNTNIDNVAKTIHNIMVQDELWHKSYVKCLKIINHKSASLFSIFVEILIKSLKINSEECETFKALSCDRPSGTAALSCDTNIAKTFSGLKLLILMIKNNIIEYYNIKTIINYHINAILKTQRNESIEIIHIIFMNKLIDIDKKKIKHRLSKLDISKINNLKYQFMLEAMLDITIDE